MSAFHPLGTTEDSHPLTVAPAELPFHNDDDDDAWTPPTLPGEPHIPASTSARASRTRGGAGGSVSSPLDPLRSSTTTRTGAAVGIGLANGDGAGAEEESYKRAVNKNSHDNGGSSSRNHGAAGGGQREWERGPGAGGGRAGQAVSMGGESRMLSSVHSFSLHSYYAPTFCDACGQLLIGIMQQGLQCTVCRMNIHPECRATPCSDDHRCRRPESVQISPGVDGSRVMGVRLKPGYPGGSNRSIGARSADAPPVEDPLNSDWHRQLVANKQLWVPDSVAAGCMVCSRPFNLVLRRHHCRRCGTCMCGWCSHTAVSDKILSVNQTTGEVVRLSSGDPVRCCTPCTRVLDQQLARALQRKGWGANHGTPAAIDAVRRRFSGPSSTGTPFVAAGGGGYAATLPVLSAQDTTESFDGGGFAPPASASRSNGSGNGNGNTAQAKGDSFGAEECGSSNYPDGRDGGGYSDRADGGAAGAGGIDDPLTRASQQKQQQQQQQQAPPPPPRWLEEQKTTSEVPSWLGQSSLGSSRRTGSATSAGRAPIPVAERQEQHQHREYQQQEYQQQEYQHQEYRQQEYRQQGESLEDAGGVWGEGSAGVEETTDWSNSGSVV
eukprot:g6448.t1